MFTPFVTKCAHCGEELEGPELGTTFCGVDCLVAHFETPEEIADDA